MKGLAASGRKVSIKNKSSSAAVRRDGGQMEGEEEEEEGEREKKIRVSPPYIDSCKGSCRYYILPVRPGEGATPLSDVSSSFKDVEFSSRVRRRAWECARYHVVCNNSIRASHAGLRCHAKTRPTLALSIAMIAGASHDAEATPPSLAAAQEPPTVPGCFRSNLPCPLCSANRSCLNPCIA